MEEEEYSNIVGLAVELHNKVVQFELHWNFVRETYSKGEGAAGATQQDTCGLHKAGERADGKERKDESQDHIYEGQLGHDETAGGREEEGGGPKKTAFKPQSQGWQ